MKKKWILITAVPLLVLLFSLGVWQFVDAVSSDLWTSSVRTITESTNQGANALDMQFEMGFAMLERMWGSLTGAADPASVMAAFAAAEPDVQLYREGEQDGDAIVGTLLSEGMPDHGILDSHISSTTGENVFHIFIRGTLADGSTGWLIKTFRTAEVADQFTLSFYGSAGFSYLVNREGRIMVRPSHRNSNKTLYNLFDMLPAEENDPQMIAAFRESVYERRSGWAKFLYDGTGLVFCYEPLRADSDWLLISIVPEPVITRQATSILQRTLVFSGTAIFVVLIIVAMFYGMKMHENEVHTQELQTALHAADAASRAKSRFLMNMSHDIRTPLNAIIGMTAIAQQNTGDSSKLSDCLHKIEGAGAHLLSLVSDVMDLSQIEQGKLILKEETVYLPNLFEEAAGLMRRRAQENGLTLESAPVQLENEYVTSDPLRIRQILLNIISNAVKYTPSGGEVRLSLTQEARADGEGTIYRFCCADTGIGMEPAFMERMFQPFERARNSTDSGITGTGVGLSITKSLLELMGGTVTVTSAPGKGSTFTLEFPFPPAEAPPEPKQPDPVPNEAAAPQEAGRAGQRVLLVEDNELNMEIMEELMDILEVEFEEAENGQKAVQMVQEKPAGYFDLVFMDIQMPVMDGYEAARRIRGMDRADAKTLPIYAVSANALADDVKNALDAGMNGHIPKPVDLDALEKALRCHPETAGGKGE